MAKTTIGKTPQARLLWAALRERGIDAITEHPDGHKHVDIAVLDAKLYIEVDGIQHFTDPKQIEADFKREHYSDQNGFATFFVTNQIIDRYLNEVAKALHRVIKDRQAALNPHPSQK